MNTEQMRKLMSDLLTFLEGEDLETDAEYYVKKAWDVIDTVRAEEQEHAAQRATIVGGYQ